MPTVLQTYKLEAYRASQYLDLCIRAGMKKEKAKKEYTDSLTVLLAFKHELGIRINAILTDEYHKGQELISIDRIGQLTGLTRADLLEILPELLTHQHRGYFKLSSLRQLTY